MNFSHHLRISKEQPKTVQKMIKNLESNETISVFAESQSTKETDRYSVNIS